ncbi:Mor transcription activator family protein [Burkholderia gladioli]|uniref:Mor transcription activator family protein n=1 Tax=Burkholderia gladioli TaxID=28095 RepID=UPI001640E5BF|nr:Mor transcription activator family protein [Burkholderia gladioli]
MSVDRLLTQQDIEPLERLLDADYPERLREIAVNLYAELLERDELVASLGQVGLAELAIAQTERLSTNVGGHNFYMPKGVSFRLTPRNRQMCAEFRGNNYEDLARRYHLSVMRVRQIVDAWRQEQFLARQGALDLPAD